jgi:hypothetical protein
MICLRGISLYYTLKKYRRLHGSDIFDFTDSLVLSARSEFIGAVLAEDIHPAKPGR